MDRYRYRVPPWRISVIVLNPCCVMCHLTVVQELHVHMGYEHWQIPAIGAHGITAAGKNWSLCPK